MSERDFGQETLKSGAAFDALAANASIIVDEVDSRLRPTIGFSAIRQTILQLSRFNVLLDLLLA